ncbi:hypothetical protein Bpfe_005424 [Biomphalaria pfeifferi]|uniref:Uncharacterized protein n=1 Tax=Biomphalaria pfeifferi TaxID=112525 RepID=A0AAD8C322_BIOPF|nr:hypothetical protein Bpfe_005424 [Biomphalaria pfeifferi]
MSLNFSKISRHETTPLLQDVIMENGTLAQDVIPRNVTTVQKLPLKNVTTEPRFSSEKCHHCSKMPYCKMSPLQQNINTGKCHHF